ncbi:hypothetical protein WSM22_31580 [Cytophagales bacterium WSM2-2]|nr:hypothetical protein WSM22_31580 [Cytophagales bacterium WSM2-2]
MANVITPIDEWSVKDLEDNSALRIVVEGCSELGNNAKPGIRVMFLGYTINFEPNRVEQWAYKAGKENKTEYILDDSWMVHADQYIKVSLLTGTPLKARVEVKTRSSKPVIKEYDLPFQV